MSMVWPCPLDVEAYIERGAEIEIPLPPCPTCGGPMGRWSGYERHLRANRDRVIWVPRLRCGGCGRTQALIPWFVLPWRWDEMGVIGRTVELAAEGWGHRRIAAKLGRPPTTVRDWLRRVRRRAGEIRARLLSLAVAWGWRGWETATEALPRLMEGVRALAVEWERRHGSAEPWRVVNVLTGGSLLATNRTSLLAAERTSGWMAASTDSEVPHGP